jgi:hypothetical protein
LGLTNEILGILVPVLYYTNTWDSQYLPISSRTSFDNKGKTYQVTKILTPNMGLDLDAFKAYSPLFLSATYAVSYGLSFAACTSTIVHVFLYCRKQLWSQLKGSQFPESQQDVHARLMNKYKRVPEWWFAIIFGEFSPSSYLFHHIVTLIIAVTFVISVLSFELWPTEFPIWAFIIALLIAALYTVPTGILMALTNQQVSLNVITELIVGYMLPGSQLCV